MKEIKTEDEMIVLLRNRNVNIDSIEEQRLKKYLRKYNYTTLINPYKPIHSNKIIVNSTISEQHHVYDKNANYKAYIDHFNRDKEVSNILFK